MYGNARSRVRTLAGTSDEFGIGVGVHQGSALSPLLLVLVVPRRLEVGEDSLEIVDSFCYLGDALSCGGGVELAVRDRISGTWSKRRELASLLVNHSILLEKRAKVYCACVKPALLYAAETRGPTENEVEMVWSCKT